jgi:acyl dehydratase
MTPTADDYSAGLLATNKKYLVAKFTKRDLILYALGIGCGSGSNNPNNDDEDDNDRELCYVYEENLKIFPSFLLSLPFVAEREQQQHFDNGIQLTHSQHMSSFGIRSFPPESMMHYSGDGTKCGILPRHFFLGQDIDLQNVQSLPILHVSQSLIILDEIEMASDENHNVIDQPTQIRLETRIVSVEPRRQGTFVTSETSYHQFGKCIAVAQMVALIVGLDRHLVVPLKPPPFEFKLGDRRTDNREGKAPVHGIGRSISNERTVVRYRIPQNSALLYRLSGDYNPIHVRAECLDSNIDSHAKGRQKKRIRGKPVLHGLCTLGYAVRGVLRHVDKSQANNDNERFQSKLTSLQCNFVEPVFVNDALCVEVWNDEKEKCTSDHMEVLCVCFVVSRELPTLANDENRVMVLNGKAEFCRRHREEVERIVSRL